MVAIGITILSAKQALSSAERKIAEIDRRIQAVGERKARKDGAGKRKARQGRHPQNHARRHEGAVWELKSRKRPPGQPHAQRCHRDRELSPGAGQNPDAADGRHLPNSDHWLEHTSKFHSEPNREITP